MEEMWEDIPGYEGHYQVSSAGKIFSYKTNRIISQNHFREGYKMTILSKDGKSKQFSVHRLVAEVFVPNPENKPIVNHKDGVKDNNYWLNLEYVTSSENTYHALRTGLKRILKGEEIYNCKIKDHEVFEIFSLRKQGLTLKQIGDIFNVKISTIYNILKGNSRKHLKDKIHE